MAMLAAVADRRGLPANLESEQIILALAMEDPTQTRRLVAELAPEDFSSARHQQLWYLIRDMVQADRQVSRVLVVEELFRLGKLESAGGFGYISGLDPTLGKIIGPDEYIAQIRDASVRRRVVVACQSLMDQCYTDDAATVQASLESLESAIADKLAEGSGSGLKSGSEVLRSVGGPAGLFKSAQHGLQTPWKDLNRLTMGLHRGQMIVLAARTGRGKSAAAAQIAECALGQHSGAVAVFSLEMRAESILRRMACASSGVPANAVRRGELSHDQRAKLQQAALSLAGDELYLSDRMRVTITSLYRGLQHLKHRGPIALAVVDYLQLMSGGAKAENRQQEIAAISRGLKTAAVEFDIPILVLCQYNREADKGETRPALHHIRESGAIGHDADMVWLFHEPEGMNETGWITELIVEKQREGPTGSIRLWFDRQKTRFAPVDERE
jgi:replicative DNA helicase